MTKAPCRVYAPNNGGIASDFHAGLDFYVVWEDPDGTTHAEFHNTAHVSVKAMLANRSVRYEDALTQKM